MTDSTARTIATVLLVVWALLAILFVLKLRSAFDHPLTKPNPGGLLFLVSQAALGSSLLLTVWRKNGGLRADRYCRVLIPNCRSVRADVEMSIWSGRYALVNFNAGKKGPDQCPTSRQSTTSRSPSPTSTAAWPGTRTSSVSPS